MLRLPRRPLMGLRVLISLALLASLGIAAPATAVTGNDDTLPPSATTPASPFEASVEATTGGDARDVYSFTLTEGQFLSVDVAQTSEATASVALYGPGTTDPVDPASAISTATLETTGTSTYSKRLTAHPGQAGDYYLDVAAQSGDSTLTVAWSISNPTFALDTTSAAQTVVKGQPAEDMTFHANWGDLGSEQVTFTAEANQPWLSSVPATGSADSNTTQAIILGVDPTGLAPGVHEATATVMVAGAQPRPFRVSLRVLDQPTMSISIPSTYARVNYGTVVPVSGSLRNSAGILVPNQKALLQRSYDGVSKWTTISSPVSATGSYRVNATVDRNTYFRWVFSGAGDLAPSAPTVKKLVSSYAYVTRPSIPKRLRPKRTYTFRGYLKPKHASGSQVIRVYWEYKSRGKWRKQASIPLLVSNYRNPKTGAVYSTYSYKDRYGRGVHKYWRVRVVHSDAHAVASDGDHLTTTSAWEYYKVY